MNQIIALMLNTALIILEDCMFLILVNGVFTPKRSNKYTGVSFAILVVASCVFLYFFGRLEVAKTVLPAVLYSAWLLLCYETSWYKAVFAVLFWFAYLIVGDNGLLALISALTDRGQTELMFTPESYYFICFSIKAAELLGITVLHTWFKHHRARAQVTLTDWLKVIIFPVAMLVVSAILLKIYYHTPEMAMELTICNVIILLVDLISFFLMNYLEKQQAITRDNIILRKSMKIQLDNVEAWRKAYEGQRKQSHDFQNQLSVIHGLVQHASPKETLRYIERLQHIDPPGILLVQTHRTAVDILLNQKYAIAEDRKICFKTQLDDLSLFPLPDDAFIVVLSNLIDNAIEACEKIEDESSRQIILKMKVENDAAFLYIENSTALPVEIRNNRVVTTKNDVVAHGYGLQNVIAVLEEYNSLYLIEYNSSEKTFSFSAQFLQLDSNRRQQ